MGRWTFYSLSPLLRNVLEMRIIPLALKGQELLIPLFSWCFYLSCLWMWTRAFQRILLPLQPVTPVPPPPAWCHSKNSGTQVRSSKLWFQLLYQLTVETWTCCSALPSFNFTIRTRVFRSNILKFYLLILPVDTVEDSSDHGLRKHKEIIDLP